MLATEVENELFLTHREEPGGNAARDIHMYYACAFRSFPLQNTHTQRGTLVSCRLPTAAASGDSLFPPSYYAAGSRVTAALNINLFTAAAAATAIRRKLLTGENYSARTPRRALLPEPHTFSPRMVSLVCCAAGGRSW